MGRSPGNAGERLASRSHQWLPAGSGGRSATSGGSQPPVLSVARIRSLVSFSATPWVLSQTVVMLRGRAGAKPACQWAPSLTGRSVHVGEVPETVAARVMERRKRCRAAGRPAGGKANGRPARSWAARLLRLGRGGCTPAPVFTLSAGPSSAKVCQNLTKAGRPCMVQNGTCRLGRGHAKPLQIRHF